MMRRWWIYQKERFPVFAHGPLIAAFSACAVAFSSMLRDAPPPGLPAYLTAFGVCFLMFLQLRIADEFKDRDEDARWRPYRPVPRGLVRLSELRALFIIAGLVQCALAWWLDARLVAVLAVAWCYLGLMSVEFFCRDWLKARPMAYLVSHMGIMPLVDFFGTACEWLPRGSAVPDGLGWFLTASFCNGIVIETGRKIRQPADEEEGVETYSRLWGRRRAVAVWLALMAATLACAALAAAAIGFVLPLATGLGILLLLAMWVALRFVRAGLPGRWLEAVSGVWTLVLYLLLGLVPLWLRA